jgi:hypothetical protein
MNAKNKGNKKIKNIKNAGAKNGNRGAFVGFAAPAFKTRTTTRTTFCAARQSVCENTRD